MGLCSSCGQSLPPGARFCPRCAAPVDITTGPSEERKVATVLFADLAGSTALADGEDPERTRWFLDRFYSAMAEEISRGGGTLDKFLGDGVLAVFGAPLAVEDHAERALGTAVAMRERIRGLFGPTIGLRIGVNTGELVVGDDRRTSSLLTGDAVNVAARLEQVAEPGEIVVGERTVRASRGGFVFSPARTIDVKGKSAAVVCRSLLGVGAEASAGAVRPRRVVGREPELSALRSALSGVERRGEPELLMLLGDPGIGKTTIIEELVRRIGGEPSPPLVRLGRCRPTERGATYPALGDIVRQHHGLAVGEPPEHVRARLGERWALGLPLGLEPPADIHPLAVQERLRGDWRALCRELVQDGAAVIIVEDVHWAEEILLELVEDVARDVAGPLLVIGTGRRERLRRLPRDAARLELHALGAEDSDSLLAELAPPEIAEPTRAAILERAGGNPLFLSELVRSVAERRSEEDPMLPDTVQAVTAARIDLLEPRQKAAMQAAAVIGRTFWFGALAYLLEGAAPDLAVLEERGLVRVRAESRLAGETEYELSHALIREVAYEAVPRAQRARLHARFAGWLETRTDRPTEHAARLAHHYSEAVRRDHADLAWAEDAYRLADLTQRARHWLRIAASSALGRFELDAALSFLERALAFTSEDDPGAERSEVLREIARAHALRFDGRAFREAMEQAIEAAPVEQLAGEFSAELAFQTLIRAGMWNPPPGSSEVEAWVRAALETDGLTDTGRARALIARGYSDDTKPVEAVGDAIAAAEASGDTTLRSYAIDLQASRELALGDAHAAHELHLKRVALARRITDPDHLADIHVSAIAPALAAGRLASARAHAQEHERITGALSDHHRVHGVAATLEIEQMLGDWDAVRALQERVEDAVEANVGTPCSLNPRSLLVCAVARAHAGDEAEAERLERAAGEYDLSGYGTVISTPRLRLALLRGDHELAESLLGRPAIRRTNWVYLWSMATHLDALAALGKRRRLEKEATPLLRTEGYLAPFALRALGVVQEDEELLETAETRFANLGLERHAETTRLVRRGAALV
jgi:class 3 adenylate cyclase